MQFAAGEHALRAPIEQLRGLTRYYVGVDDEVGKLTNVSVWESLSDARQMSELTAMLSQRYSNPTRRLAFLPFRDARGCVSHLRASRETLRGRYKALPSREDLAVQRSRFSAGGDVATLLR